MRSGLARAATAILLAAACSQPATTNLTTRAGSVATRLKPLTPELRAEIGALQYFLDREQIDEFFSLPSNDDRRAWIDNHWRWSDPILTTEINEMRLEHDRRVAYAETAFSVPHWPGWDERGEAYIRYGRPDFRHPMSASTDQWGVVPPRELWGYGLHGAMILFEDSFNKGFFTRRLIREGDVELQRRMKRITAPIDAQFYGMISRGESAMPDFEAMDQYVQLSRMLNRFDAVVKEVPASYPFNLAENRLPLFFGVYNFRGGDNLNRVEVDVEFLTEPGASRYVATAVVWDKDFVEVARNRKHIDISPPEGEEDCERLMPAQLLFSLVPDFYHVGLTVQELDTGRFSSYRVRATCRDFARSLTASDIVFASKIAEVSRQSPFNRGAFEVVPHPMRCYGSSASVPAYLEVYNLFVGDNGLSSYTVEYRITSDAPRPVGILGRTFGEREYLDVSSSFRSSSHGPHDAIHMTVRTDHLWVGEFTFRVKVVDDLTLAEVERTATFRIVE